MKKTRLTVITNIIINTIFYLGIPVCLSVPYVIYRAGEFNTIFNDYYWQMVLTFLLSGIFAELIFFELRRIFRTVLAGDPFVTANVNSLKRMGYYSFVITVITISRLFIVVTPAVLVVILVFSIAGLFSLVLSQVFHQAVVYKLENDLTI